MCNFAGLVLKEPITICGYPGFKTQVRDIVVILGSGMFPEKDLQGNEVNQYLQLSIAVGHSSVVPKVLIFLQTCNHTFAMLATAYK